MATATQKSRTSSSAKGTTKVTTSKGDVKTITKGTAGAVSISSAAGLSFSTVEGLVATNVQSALAELGQRFFQVDSGTTPSVGVNEGDLWYDLSTDRLKLYDGSSWSLISGAATNLNDDYFKFTTSAALSSGNVAEFWNTTNKVWNLQHDGVMVLKNQASEPTAVTNGVYVDGDNMYLGVADS